MKQAITDTMPRGIGDPFDTINWLDLVIGIVKTLDSWKRRARTRRDFADLDDRLLRDIGVDRVDRWIEINKPFWRA